MEDLHNIQCKTKLLTKRYLYLQYTLKYEQQRIMDQYRVIWRMVLDIFEIELHTYSQMDALWQNKNKTISDGGITVDFSIIKVYMYF